MGFFDYLVAAPWWHWPFLVVLTAILSQWRPIKISKDTHEHKHVHTGKDKE